jgi:hypothetical protein
MEEMKPVRAAVSNNTDRRRRRTIWNEGPKGRILPEGPSNHRNIASPHESGTSMFPPII